MAFYLGQAADDHGRSFDSILAHDDEWLEYTHNFIQWLFPLTTASGANPTAPVLSREEIGEFRANPVLRQQLLRAFERMLNFYGLARNSYRIGKSLDWPRRKSLWFTQPSHNHLRITRILKCLNTLGQEQEARAFHQALLTLKDSETDCGIPASAFHYWAEAVTG